MSWIVRKLGLSILPDSECPCHFQSEPSSNSGCISNSKLNMFGTIFWHWDDTGIECSTPTLLKPSKQDSCIPTVYQALGPLIFQLCLVAHSFLGRMPHGTFQYPEMFPGMLKLDVASHSCHRFGRSLSPNNSISQFRRYKSNTVWVWVWIDLMSICPQFMFVL